MAKISKCSFKGCDNLRMRKPGNTTLCFKFCQEHQIKVVLSKQRVDTAKYKAGLDIMRKRTSKTHNRKKTPKQAAMDRADEWFSKYIRLKYAYESGSQLKCKCYTCDKEHDILDVENGHFQSRRHKATRYGLNNARPQDPYCNKHLNGNNTEFEKRLITEVGKEEVEAVKLLAQTNGEDTEIYYRQVSDKFRKMFKGLMIERDLINPWKQ